MKLWQYAAVPMCAVLYISVSGSPAAAYKHNYTCGEQGQRACEADETPKPIMWEDTCIEFYLDQGGLQGLPSDQGYTGPEIEEVVERSFEVWAEPECAGITVEYAGMIDPEKAAGQQERRNIVIFKDEGWPANSHSTFATTPVSYDPQTGVIREASIEVNDEFYTYSISETPDPDEADLLNTMVHEAGHFLGIGHSKHPEASMFGQAQLGETKKRDLHRDDIDGLCDYYSSTEYAASCRDNEISEEREQQEEGGSIRWSEDSYQQTGCGSADGAPFGAPWLFVGLIGGLWWRRRARYCDEN